MIRVEQLHGASRKRYVRFCKSVYDGYPQYRGSVSSLLEIVLSGESEFGKRARTLPILAVDRQGRPLAGTVLCRVDAAPEVLQMGFFEAGPRQDEAVASLVTAAREHAAEVGCSSIVAGLNGHVNYGLGFLADHFDSAPCFGSAYNPPYYLDYLAAHSASETRLESYVYDLAACDFEKDRRLLDRISGKYRVRTADLGSLKEEISLYTRLNNDCFRGHPLYAERSCDEDYELFKPFCSLIRGEHLLFAEADGEAIGFLLWYPDYNELVPPGSGIGVGTLIRRRILRKKIRRFKIAEIGVLPKYQGSGAIVGLVRRCFELARVEHAVCESGWVFDDNLDSQSICKRWAGQRYKSYKVFHINP